RQRFAAAFAKRTSARAGPPRASPFGFLFLQEFPRGAALHCVQDLVSIFVELLDQFRVFLHASRWRTKAAPSFAARTFPGRTAWELARRWVRELRAQHEGTYRDNQTQKEFHSMFMTSAHNHCYCIMR